MEGKREKKAEKEKLNKEREGVHLRWPMPIYVKTYVSPGGPGSRTRWVVKEEEVREGEK